MPAPQSSRSRATLDHRPTCCARCGDSIPAQRCVCYTAYESTDLELGDVSKPGLWFVNIEHRWYEAPCACGHLAEPYRAPAATGDWEGIALTEWRPIGPALAALLVWVRFRMRL